MVSTLCSTASIGPNDKKTFKTGDLVKVDIGAQIDGYISDNATTVEVGGKGGSENH